MPEIVPDIRFDGGVWETLAQRRLSVAVDYNELEKTLTELGEYNFPERTPLNLIFETLPSKEAHAFAELVYDPSSSQPVARNLHLPIFDLAEGEELVLRNEDTLNYLMLHELRHCVDYNDHEFVNKEIEAQKQYKKRQNYERKALKSSASVIALGSTAIGVKGGIDRDYLLTAVGTAFDVLAFQMFRGTDELLRLKEKINNATRPHELNAYFVGITALKDNSLPSIVKIIESGQDT
jgi:hypothetical protein